MYEKRVLGDHNGYSLINSMWLICTTHFGMRTGKETHNLKWGDIRLGLDPQSGSEYIQLDTERQTKTRTGEDSRHTRLLRPIIFHHYLFIYFFLSLFFVSFFFCLFFFFLSFCLFFFFFLSFFFLSLFFFFFFFFFA